MSERPEAERVLDVLRPYAANWSGSLGRGDLVIPRRDIPRLVGNLIDAVTQCTAQGEVGDAELFRALVEVQRLSSVQDRADRLRRIFRILRR